MKLNKKDFKIHGLYDLNRLNEKCRILLNNHINDEFYECYFLNNLDWLIENQEKISNDFSNNLYKIKFDVIFSDLDDRVNLILNIKDLEEFAGYVYFIPFKILKKRKQNKIKKMFTEFQNIKDDYDKLKYFDSIKR